MTAAAGVTQSIFIDSEGTGYWCGEGMGELKEVRQTHTHTHTHTQCIIIPHKTCLFIENGGQSCQNGATRATGEGINWKLAYSLADVVRSSHVSG